MKRRDFIALSIAATVSPLTARAQQAGTIPVVGVVGTKEVIWTPWLAVFVKRLNELGWIDGRTIKLEYRWSDGRADRITEIADEFVRSKVDVILTEGTGGPIVQRATSTIPIVLAISIDPVGSGLVKSLAHPGGNVTGLSNEGSDLASKRLELLREVVPKSHRLAIIVHVEQRQAMIELGKVDAAARTLGLEVVRLEIHRADEIASAIETLSPKADALYVVSDALLIANVGQIIGSALDAKLPTIFNNSAFVKVGGLLSYGPNYLTQFRQSADIVNKILHGTTPADIPVQQPTQFELVLNLKTAKALGVKFPSNLVTLADEVIE